MVILPDAMVHTCVNVAVKKINVISARMHSVGVAMMMAKACFVAPFAINGAAMTACSFFSVNMTTVEIFYA
jgi:hypothetical protein